MVTGDDQLAFFFGEYTDQGVNLARFNQVVGPRRQEDVVKLSSNSSW